MRSIKKTYETGYCFGGTRCRQFESFSEAFIQASEEGLNYVVCCQEFLSGAQKKTFICWDNVKILTFSQILERLEDPADQRAFKQRRNQDGIFLFNGEDEEPIYPRSFMSGIHFHKVERLSDERSRFLKEKFSNIYASA